MPGSLRIIPFLALLLSLGVAPVWGVPAGPAAPNILFILADDLGINDLRSFALAPDGTPAAAPWSADPSPTPRIDALAASGLRFSRFYADSSCAASRAGFLTGRPPVSLGFRPAGAGLAPEIETLPEALRRLGYTTHHVGKWHLGYRHRQAWPLQQGYDSFYGFLNQFMLGATGARTLGRPTYRDPSLQRNNDDPRAVGGHLTELLGDEAVRLIGEGGDGDRPWFISFWPYAPHEPLQPPSAIAARYPDSAEGRYLAHLASLDAQVGRLIDALERSGQAQNTLIVFASDNGGTGRHRQSNGPLPGTKVFYYEGGVRVPLFFTGAGVPRRGRDDRIASYLDLLPTLRAVAGEAAPGDSLDLLAPVSSPGAPRRDNLYWSGGIEGTRQWSVLSADGRWRLVTDVLYPRGILQDPLSPAPLQALHNPSLRTALTRDFERWAALHRQVEVVDQAVSGRRRLEGNLFQRSPGLGAHAMALCIDGLGAGTGKQLITHHEGVWELAVERGLIRWQINNVEVEAALPEQRGGRLLLLSHFRHRLTKPADSEAQMTLLFDQQVLARRSVRGVPAQREHLDAPLFIGQDSRGERGFAGTIGPVAIFNDLPPEHARNGDDWLAWSGGFHCAPKAIGSGSTP